MTVAVIVLAIVATGAIVVLIFWAVRLVRANIETSLLMATSDREQHKLVLDLFGRLRSELEKVSAILGTVSAIALRLENDGQVVAADLAVAQAAVDGVAVDLADSHKRADATTGPHGAAADAASQSAPGQ